MLRARSTRLLTTLSKQFVQVERHEGYAVVRMDRPPVNSLSLEMLQALDSTIATLEKDKTVKALILESANPKIFTAGLDIQEMYQPKHERLRIFWRTLQLFYLRLYTTPLLTVAAIEGHSPAGGCSIAMGCDSRVMATGHGLIGMNETKLGLVAPFWIKDVMKSLIGHRETERMLGLGLQVNAERAQEIGLVDRAVAPDQVHSVAKALVDEWLTIPGHARKATKALVRQEIASRLKSNMQEDEDYVVDLIESERIQLALGQYLASLKRS